MILIDTSVVIDFARTADPGLAQLFATRPVYVCGIVRAEVLNGVRGRGDRARQLAIIDSFGQLAMPETLWDEVGNNLRVLRVIGLNLPFQDVVIASLAIDAGCELWTRDHHFSLMQPHLPALRLFAEPP